MISRNFCRLLNLMLLFGVCLQAALVLGQTASPAPPAKQGVQTHRRSSLEERVKQFAKALDLNEAQQAAVKKVLQDRQQEAMRIRLDSSIPGSARIDRFRALQDKTVQRIREVLNDEQKKKYDPLAPRKVQPAPDQRSVEDWLKLTSPK